MTGEASTSQLALLVPGDAFLTALKRADVSCVG